MDISIYVFVGIITRAGQRLYKVVAMYSCPQRPGMWFLTPGSVRNSGESDQFECVLGNMKEIVWSGFDADLVCFKLINGYIDRASGVHASRFVRSDSDRVGLPPELFVRAQQYLNEVFS